MSILAVAEGLYIGFELFNISDLDIKVKNLEKKVESLQGTVDNLQERLEKNLDLTEKLSSYSRNSVRDFAMKLLGTRNAANKRNADAVEMFVASLGGTINAVTFKGKKRSGGVGIMNHRGFVSGTQSLEKIFFGLRKMTEMESIIGGRIVTTCLANDEDLEALGLAICSFYHIIRIMGLKKCSLTDESDNEALTIRFEGRYSLEKYIEVSEQREERAQIIRGARKNIYILGTNGVGKSSWGNLLSGEDVFEVGTSDHTTMIPQAFDIESDSPFRLWDTPGLFDGTEQAGIMQDHMDTEIRINAYCSGVLFVFSGATPANQITVDTLEYAKEQFGDHVLDNFVAIVNDIGGLGEGKLGSYLECLDGHGFKLKPTNVFVASALNDDKNVRALVRNLLSEFEPVLIKQFMKKYKDIIESTAGNLTKAVSSAHADSKKELSDILRQGKITVKRHMGEKLKKNLDVPVDVIVFQQYSRGYMGRMFFKKSTRLLLERTVLLEGSKEFKARIKAHMNMEFQSNEVGVFLNLILKEERHLLIHTPHERYDYVLKDATSLDNGDLVAEIERLVFKSRR